MRIVIMGRTETSVEIGKYLNSLIVQDPLFNKTPPNDFQSMVLAQQYDSNQVVITLPVSDNDTNSKFIVNGKPILPIALPHHPQQFLFPNLNNGSQFIQVAYSKEGETPSIVDIGSTYIDSPAKELTVNHIEHYDNRVLEIEGKAESLCEIIVTRLDGLEVARSKVDIKGHYTLRIEEVDENMSELLLSLIDKMHNITQFVQHIELEVQSDARNETLHFLGEDETRVVNGVLDFKEAVLFTVVEARGDFGTLSLDKSSGAYTYTQALSVARMNYKTATKTYSGQDSFEIHIEESSGNKKRQYLTFYPTATLSAPKEEEAECTISMISFTSPKITSIAPSAVKISIPLNSVSIELNEKLHIEEREESNLTNLVRPSISGQSAISFSKIRLYVQKEDTWSEIARTVSDSNGYYSLISTELNDGFHTFLTHALAPSSTISVESSPLEIVIDSSIIIEVEQECEEDVGITLSGNILDSEGQDLIEFKHEKKSLIYGDFEIEEEGSWTYTFSKTSRIDTLNENERLEESILVSTQEGDLEKLIINIYGTQKGIHLNATHKQNSCGRLKIDEVDESIEYVLEDEIGSFGRLTLEKSSGLYTYVQNISIDGLHYNKENKNYEGKELFKTDTLYFSFDVGASVVLLDGKLHINTLVPANMRIGESLPELENQTEGSDDNGVVLELEHQTDENSSMPTLKGTTDIAYSQVIVFDGSTAVGSALSDENGFYKIVTAHLGEGSHSLSVKATSPFSKEALESSSLEYVIINQEIKEETKVDTIQSFSANVFENDDLDGTRD